MPPHSPEAYLADVVESCDAIVGIPRVCPPDLYIGWCRSNRKTAVAGLSA